MANLIAFINAFLSYLLLAVLITVLVLIAIFIGIKLRKNKDLKDSESKTIGDEGEQS